MDPSKIALIAALVVLLLLSAFFSASETAFSSLNRVRMKSMAASKNKRAAHSLALAEQYDKLLSTVLVGNNLVNILSTSIATLLFVALFGNLGVTIATVIMTILVLIVGEITPKTLAKEAPESVAMAVTTPLRVVITLLTPVNAAFAAWKRFVFKIFRLKSDDTISEQELLTYVEEVREDGTISEQEEDLIRSVIEFDDVQAIEICTPRVDVVAVPITEPKEKINRLFYETGFSRLPIYKGTIDSIAGIILEKDFHYYVMTLNQSIEDIIRPAIHITKSLKISTLLAELQQKKTHIAVLVDEYGGTIGIVTIEDILEELVGEIWDEHDEIKEEIRKLAPGRYRVLGGTDIEELFDLFKLEDRDDIHSLTTGGWVLEHLGHIPKKGESFDYKGVHLEVEDMSRNRVTSILAQVLPKEEASSKKTEKE